MKKQLLVVLATGLFLYGMTSTAMALSFAGSSNGTFYDPTGASSMVTTGVNTNLFTWGDGTNFNSLSSSLEYVGGDPFSMESDVGEFQIGTLNYFNGTVLSGTQAETVELDIQLMFTSPQNPGVPTQNFSFSLDLENTLNNTGTEDGDADYVTFSSAYSQTIYSEGGIDYTLTLWFGNITGGGFGSSNEFHVYEGYEASAQLIGTITSNVTPVPEPATMLLFGTGIAGLAGYRRRQQAKKK